MYYGILVISTILYVLVSLSSVFAEFCPRDFKCGNFGNLGFPFSNYSEPNCGLIMANCTNQTSPMVSLDPQMKSWYKLLKYPSHGNSIIVVDIELDDLLSHHRCRSFDNPIIPQPDTNASVISFTINPNITLFKCINDGSNYTEFYFFKNLSKYDTCHQFTIYYMHPKYGDYPSYGNLTFPPNCVPITLPMASDKSFTNESDFFGLLSAEFVLSWNVSEECVKCSNVPGNHCATDGMGRFSCDKYNASKHGKYRLGIIIGSVIGVLFILVSLFCAFLVCYRKKVAKGGSYLQSRGVVKLPSSKSDIEDGSVC